MRPDEAFGLIFNWDNVVANTREVQRRAWRAVAEAEGLPFPAMERPQLYDVRPERAATDVSGRAAHPGGWVGRPRAARRQPALSRRQALLPRPVSMSKPASQRVCLFAHLRRRRC